ncbi:cation diffusion facilitator CzcD-associated flavoprotein CzcO [Litorivivens lipolytica]|uniref:Cation diffusion facilitator CzcD-associated flavoprotein CzcO n=1 Tax=Litorivivens lipolytica TaxID=1524264 RepID=A0A7W4W5D7_9GAMM|nr:NAD(P)/FAD-dependent oxidoreductase [Litorivivens lipolytica]MBB3047413.1 cation diffusion facilitator CzcD-associated flavoprotein CzcO [Litorivivens lipolytica]
MSATESQRELRFVVMGAGMAGILAAIKLREAGHGEVAVYEKADRIGGTWRENTYPGLTCDVPSHSYTYSFEPNPDWSRYLPPGAEIQDYFERTTRKYGIDKLIRFNEEIISCEYRNGRWQIETKSGLRDEADVVIAATGVLHVPRYPDIDGIEDFEGAIFHTSRWDHSVPLDDRRIGVIGTGSTGVQIVSALSKRVKKLVHFQRTPQWIMPVENPEFSEEQKAAFRNDPELLKYMQNEPEYLANVERFTNAIVEPESPAMEEIETIVRDYLENSIRDPELREKLRPSYRAACKRLIYSPDFYEAVQRPSVEVELGAIERIEAKGVRLKDGTLHELDVIALATGFKADQFMRPMNVVGRNGVELNEVWADTPRAYLSISIPEFPNLFMLNGPNGPVGNFSLIDIAEHQWHYIEQLIAKLESGECAEVCATQSALDAFDKARLEAAKKTIFGSGCQSWYLDANGVPATWPWTQKKFYEAMAEPDFSAFELVSLEEENAGA